MTLLNIHVEHKNKRSTKIFTTTTSAHRCLFPLTCYNSRSKLRSHWKPIEATWAKPTDRTIKKSIKNFQRVIMVSHVGLISLSSSSCLPRLPRLPRLSSKKNRPLISEYKVNYKQNPRLHFSITSALLSQFEL